MNAKWMVVLALAACGGEGRVEIGLRWPEDVASDGAWIFARVESRQVSTEPGPVLAEVSPIEHRGSGTRIELPEVPNGDRRVLVVEVRRQPARDATVELFGFSEPFSLSVGEERTVRLEVPLTRPPQILGLGIDGFAGEEEAIVPSSTVALHVSSDSGQRVRISNDPDLLPGPGTQDFELADARGSQPGLCPPPPGAKRGCTYRIEWDLLAGASGCEEGCLRRVFVRFVDAFGYTSATLARFVVIDPRGPLVLPESVGVQLVPSQDNLRIRPRTVRPGTRVIVTFGFDEIATPLRVRTTAPETIELVAAGAHSGSRTTYVYEHTVPTGSFPTEGPYFLEVTARDQAGHARTSRIAAPGLDCDGCAFIVDVTPPAPPDVDAEGAVVLHRIPWTRDPSFGFARTTVVVQRSAVELGAAVLVEDPVLGELGRSAPADESSFGPITLGAADASQVMVRSIDLAGNVSAPARIRDVRWTGTLTGKIEGNASPNPNAVFRGSEERDAIWQRSDRIGDEPSSEEVARASAVDGAALEARSTARWRLASSTPPGASATFFGAAYDSRRGRTVLPGAATWAFDGLRWGVLDTAGTAPPGGARSTSIYDPVRDLVFHFVGAGDLTVGFVPAELWIFDGRRWSEVVPAEDSEPPADAIGVSLAIDTRMRELLVFGGVYQGTYLADLHAFDGERWRSVSDAALIRPPPRAGAAFAYDPVRHRAVLFGGEYRDPSTEMLVQRDDTWEWDGSEWFEGAAGARPPAGAPGRMLFDPMRERILWLGDSGALWSWDGTVWTELDPALDLVAIPSALRRSGAETLIWNGTAWSEVMTAAGAPPGSCCSMLTYDRERGRMIAIRPNPPSVYERAGGEWIQAASSVPALGGYLRQIEDAPGGEVMIQIDTGATWLWNGTTFRLHQGTTPGEHTAPPIAYDSARQRTLLFGGFQSADSSLWAFDGLDWSATTPAGISPEPRGFAGSMFDPLRGRFTIFGGALWNQTNVSIDGSVNDTWIWEGARWVQVALLPPIPERRDSTIFRFDERQGRAVLFGLQDVDTWLFDGASWREVALDGVHPPVGVNIAYPMIYDPELEQITVWSPTERWILVRADRPSLSFQIDWSQASVPVDSIRRIEVRAVAGGTGCAARQADCPLADGARLFVRSNHADRWLWPAETSASLADGAPLSIASATSEEAKAMVSAGAIDVLLQPIGIDFGEVNAGVAVDYLEATVEYRLP